MKPSLSIWQILPLPFLVLPSLILLWLILLWLILLWAWPALPARIPSHFGIGNIGDYTSRDNIWLLTSALPLGTYLMLVTLPRFDPRRLLVADSRSLHKLTLLLVGGISLLACYSLYLSLHPLHVPGWEMGAGICLFLVLLGSYLTTVPPNYFLGVRTPWTLESNLVWLKTHRLMGRLFFGAGLALLALLVLGSLAWFEPALLVLVLGAVGVGYGYSYWVYRQVAAGRYP